WASGTFTCRGTQRAGNIVVCKLGWWTGAPWDVRAFAAAHPSYPGDSTLDQLYNSAEFDAYRNLGLASAELTMRECRLDPLPAPVTKSRLMIWRRRDGAGRRYRPDAGAHAPASDAGQPD